MPTDPSPSASMLLPFDPTEPELRLLSKMEAYGVERLPADAMTHDDLQIAERLIAAGMVARHTSADGGSRFRLTTAGRKVQAGGAR